MSARVWLINFVLAVATGLFGFEAYTVWSQVEKTPVPGNPAETAPVSSSRKIPVPGFAEEKSYDSVAENNLFTPERKEAEPEVQVSQPTGDTMAEAAGQAGRVFLTGVVMTEGGYAAALVRSPGARAGGKTERWVRAGDSIDGLQVASIHKDKIIVQSGSEEKEIPLHDKEKPRLQAASQAIQPTVVDVSREKPEVAASAEKTPEAAASTPTAVPTPARAVEGFGSGPEKPPIEGSQAPAAAPAAPGERPENPLVELLNRIKEGAGQNKPAGENPLQRLVIPQKDKD